MAKVWKVLFCAEGMAKAYEYTKEALATDDDVKVARCAMSDVKDGIVDADVAVPLMCPITSSVMDSARHLKLILQYGVGVEGVDIAAATARGICVSNIPSRDTGNALSCAEHAVYLMLALLRNQREMAASIQQRRLGLPCGETLYGKTVLVVGFGNIGRELVARLLPFKVRLKGVRESDKWGTSHDTAVRQLEDQLIAKGTVQDLHCMVEDVDIIAVTCPQTDGNRGMINGMVLERCKSGVRIVNVARGGLLDYEAMMAGLNSGKIGGLGLDVQWSEPFDPQDPIALHPNVVLTPHIAGVTELSYRAMAEVVAREVRRLKAGQPPTIRLN